MSLVYASSSEQFPVESSVNGRTAHRELDKPPNESKSCQAPHHPVAVTPQSLFSFYVQALPAGLRKGRSTLVFLLASAMHAVGHTALAVAAGGCARALVGEWRAMGGGSTSLGLVRPGVDAALLAGLVGLGAVILKGAGGVYAAHAQSQVASAVAGALRLRVLDGWLGAHRLRIPRQRDHGALEGARGDVLGSPPLGTLHAPDSAQASPPDDAFATPGVRQPFARGVAALTARVREVETGLQAGLLGGIRAALQLAALLAVLVWISPRLALTALLVLFPFSIALGSTRRRWKLAHAVAARRGEALLEAADEAVRHADLWTSYGAERKARANVKSLGQAISQQAARLDASTAALSAANEVLGALALVLALGAARAGWLGNAGSGATLLAFSVAFFLAYKPLRDLTDARLALLRASAAFDELRVTMPDMPGRRELRSGTGHKGPPDSASAMAYVGERADRRLWPLASLEVLGMKLGRGDPRPFSLSVGAGQIVVVLGPTGAGKTTLLRALLGLETMAGGEVRYGDTSLCGAPPGPGSRPFAWVPQDAPLLADTLEANVTLGEPADMREALAPLGAAHLVDALSGARLGAAGRAVSGGERQWICLARAIATRQPVLLLDEPTSGLDPAAETQVLNAILRLKGDRSVVMVTHRTEALAIADAVVRLGGDGKRRGFSQSSGPTGRQTL
jgi:ABC-type multidrug transport system fused ATPase/permease subunit